MADTESEEATGDTSPIRPEVKAGVMTRVVPGVVDVVVLAPLERSGSEPQDQAEIGTDRWQVLTLKRAPNTRCTGAWEIVHGRIEPHERAEQAAAREVLEETGLTIQRLYSITVNAFYLHQTGTVQLALVFAAVVTSASAITLGAEHDEFVWRTMADASEILAWPREREALAHVQRLLRTGDAGPVEDVLRII